MNGFGTKVLVFIIGLAVGLLFFGGLWLTIKKTLTAKRPIFWLFASMVLRFGTTLFVFYYFLMDSWITMLICVLGFLIARFLILNKVKVKNVKEIEIKKSN